MSRMIGDNNIPFNSDIYHKGIEQFRFNMDDFLSEMHNTRHFIGISHTDQDMLTMTFPVKFSKPTILEKSALLEEVYPILSSLQKSELL